MGDITTLCDCSNGLPYINPLAVVRVAQMVVIL